ncbi:unnamed protein product [Chrysoparadoxa australica]
MSQDLFIACRRDDAELVKKLLAGHPNKTTWSGMAPLHRCAQENSCKAAKVLMDAGANVNSKSAWGWYTPLHLACRSGHEKVAVQLLYAGAKLLVRDKAGRTPLELGREQGYDMECNRIETKARHVMALRRAKEAKDQPS